jgi:hypothetical protein
MTDIRGEVEEDRGLLKKIQLFVPGFAGYRRREDVRAADSILRLQMADALVRVREGLEECRHNMLEDYQTKNLDRVGSSINKVRTLEGKVRHAEQGYSGFSAAIRIEMAELNALYEYDARMIAKITELDGAIRWLQDITSGSDVEKARESLDKIREGLVDFERTFEERIPRIAGIYNI